MLDFNQAAESFEVSVFPLDEVVFYPATSKPLNIFEDRYIKMVNDAFKQDRLIALAYSDPDHKRDRDGSALLNIRRTAGAGRPVLLERREDSSMLILLEGVGKVFLKARVPSEEPYMICDARWIEEDTELLDQNRFLLNRLLKDLTHWLGRNLEDQAQAHSFLARIETAQEKINYLCSFMIQDPEAKQRLLETDDINERMTSACSFLSDQNLPFA